MHYAAPKPHNKPGVFRVSILTTWPKGFQV